MSYTVVSKEEREKTPMGRFEIICEAYINGNQSQRKTILEFFGEDEKKTFLKGCGLYHMFTDQRYYDAIKNAVGERLYNEAHQQPEIV